MKTGFAHTLVAAALVLVTACNFSPTDPDPVPSTKPAPSPTQDEVDLVAALRRTQRVPHHFAVDADLPKDEHLTGSGEFDVTEQLYASSTGTLDRVVIGSDYYQRDPGARWVHVDLERLKEDSKLHFGMADATGLLQFADAITEAHKTGPNTYSGRFQPDTEDFKEPFLPIGAPSLWSIGMRVSPFTVTVDAKGWVIEVSMELTPTDSPTLRMEATLSAQGQPVSVEKPTAQEADEAFYK
ncbi:hypothetical protein [Cryptosporangium arvum]|uniref:Lipoprotein n=1 Tax=Cryptosporangium arvum DSM 44712 TaxID=927661 RepID=A0A010YVQ1_9ACTN|nr:hypothetical protein [Cryptosporangium arvum]EXG79213.1 hypothetical protein CryarDRAFT_0241 [Cryptosporangium arvum DSM 44712]